MMEKKEGSEKGEARAEGGRRGEREKGGRAECKKGQNE